MFATTTATDPRFESRRWLAGAPAVIALLLGVGIYVHARSQSTAKKIEWYRQQADESFDAGDYKTALVCYARVSQARPSDLGAAFSLLQCMEAAGQHDAAASLLARLAPAASPGYPPAQVLFARRLLAKDRSPAAAKLALPHLHRAVDAGSDDPELKGLIADAAQRAAHEVSVP